MNTPTVKFQSNRDGGDWTGEANTPNSYLVIVDGIDCGVVVKRDEWAFYRRQPHAVAGVEFTYSKHASCKAINFTDLKKQVKLAAREHLAHARAIKRAA